MNRTPRVSVVISAYRSHATIRGCLASLRLQTYVDFEVIVVDSCPTTAAKAIVLGEFPEVQYVHSPERLLPHAAHNRGVEMSSSELIAFIDPDVYAAPDCLARLVAAYDETGHAIAGAIACYGRDRLDTAIHLVKFSRWLPSGGRRATDMAPTANMLCSRRQFDAVGGLLADHMLGDADFSWKLTQHGEKLTFEPAALVEHHHTSSCREFLDERYRRGVMFAELRAMWFRGRTWLNAVYLMVSVLPIRLLRSMCCTFDQCRRAHSIGSFLAASPVVCLGHMATLAGESRAHWRMLWAAR